MVYDRPLVSVVMPSYNQRKYIEQSINSVLDQDYSNIELVIADGASTDGTVELLSEKAKTDRRLRWFSREDSGPAEAINRALAETQGTIIGWLNSDDLYTLGAIKRAVEAFEANTNWIMLYGKGEHVDENSKYTNTYPSLKPSVPIQRFYDGCFICQPTVFFKKHMYVSIGDLDKSLTASFDFDYWIRAFLAFEDRIGFIDVVQAQSRIHNNSITTNARRTVAVEGVSVIAKHFGKAPIHWILTYIDELLSQHSEERSVESLREHLLEMIDEVSSKIDKKDLEDLKKKIDSDRFLKRTMIDETYGFVREIYRTAMSKMGKEGYWKI